MIPRFALAASEPILEVCQSLLKEDASLLFTTHINESPREIETVASLFPWAKDYLEVYEKFDLIGRRSVLAHNVHANDAEIARIAERGSSVAHCPCSNAALGSGIFPMRRHLERNARFALGTDVGGGTGFGILKEALQAHLLQRLAADPITVTPAQMLYLATRARSGSAPAGGLRWRLHARQTGRLYRDQAASRQSFGQRSEELGTRSDARSFIHAGYRRRYPRGARRRRSGA